MPEAETTLLFLANPSSQRDLALVEDLTGESGARVESDIMVQESAPLSLMGSVAVLLEALLAIWDLLLWNIKQHSAERAKTTPITKPSEIPTIKPKDSPPSISFYFFNQSPLNEGS